MIDKKYARSIAQSITEQKEKEAKKVKIAFQTTEKNRNILKANNVNISNLFHEFATSICEELEAINKEKTKELIEHKVEEPTTPTFRLQ